MCRVIAVDCVNRLCDWWVKKFVGEDNDNGLGGGKEVKRYRKYTPWTLPRTRKDIF